MTSTDAMSFCWSRLCKCSLTTVKTPCSSLVPSKAVSSFGTAKTVALLYCVLQASPGRPAPGPACQRMQWVHVKDAAHRISGRLPAVLSCNRKMEHMSDTPCILCIMHRVAEIAENPVHMFEHWAVLYSTGGYMQVLAVPLSRLHKLRDHASLPNCAHH
jgi:hypothetical protein